MIKRMPERMCIGCQEMHRKKELIRIVKSPQGEFSVDTVGKKPGRGAYLCKKRDCLEKAIKEKKLEKAFKMKIDEAVYTALKNEFEHDENK